MLHQSRLILAIAGVHQVIIGIESLESRSLKRTSWSSHWHWLRWSCHVMREVLVLCLNLMSSLLDQVELLLIVRE